jgi:hypothetical protein
MHRSVRLALYLLYLAAFVLAADYTLFWRPFRAQLVQLRPEDPPAPRHVSQEAMLRLGALRADRTSAFTRFEVEKRDAWLRICAFGDSFTYGDEAADGHDFPAFLPLEFDRDGMGNVEVLNFGNPWYGFHQTYILWDEVGRRFACDFLLLGPDGFQPERDTTFNHTNLAYPYYLHARYVVDGRDLRLVEVPGRSPRERIEGYLAFWPRQPYLAYDRNAPAILRAPLPWNRTLANPFYYRWDSAVEESLLIYERLLRRLADDGMQVLLFHARPEIVALAEAVRSPNLAAALAPRLERFPYLAPGGHYSAFGNRWLAGQYAAALKKNGQPPEVLEFEDVVSPAAVASGSPRAVSSFARIEVRIGGRSVGSVAIASPQPADRAGAPDALAGTPIAALFALAGRSASLVDAPFLAVRERVDAGDELFAQLADHDMITLGKVKWLDPRLAVGVVRTAGFELVNGEVVFHGNDALPAEHLQDARSEIAVLLGDLPLLRGELGTIPVVLTPVDDPVRNLRVATGQYADPDSIADGDLLTLVAEETGGALIETVVARVRRREGTSFVPSRSLPRPIERSAGRAAITSLAVGR